MPRLEQPRRTNSTTRSRFFTRGLIVVAVVAVVVLFAPDAFAQIDTGLDEISEVTQLGTEDVRITVAKIIRVFLGLLGIIALGVTLTGGFFFMTAGGSADRVKTGKMLLINGAIGLAIILSAFAITSFVMSKLVGATTGSGPGDVGRPPPPPPPPPPFLCVDRGGVDPYICSINPVSSTVGSYVTLTGYRFGTFVDGSSAVTFDGVMATIASCGDAPSWRENQVVVEVPQLGTIPGFYQAVLTSSAGKQSSNFMNFRATEGAPKPGIGCILPDRGEPIAPFTLYGKALGAADVSSTIRFASEVLVDRITSWGDTLVEGNVPQGALTGFVTATIDGTRTNGYPYTVTCSDDAQCSSGCCSEDQCREAWVCEIGRACGDIDDAGACAVDESCSAGLRCSADLCTCLLPEQGQPCDADAAFAGCQPGQCSGDLVCSPTSCTCEPGQPPGAQCSITEDQCRDDCVAGSVCEADSCTCTTPQTEGEVCSTGVDQCQDECAAGLVCGGDCRCVTGQQLNEACSESADVCQDDCAVGLTCDTSSCTCASTINSGPMILEMSPRTLVDVNGTTYQSLAEVPSGVTTVMAPNGAPENILSIFGSGFGDEPGTVTFLGTEGAEDNVNSPFASAVCGPGVDTWTDTQILIQIPIGVVRGPLQVSTRAVGGQAAKSDRTDDTRGLLFEDFVPNDVRRPGLCSVTPTSAAAEQQVQALGSRLAESDGTNPGSLFFNDAEAAPLGSSDEEQIHAVVPKLAPSKVDVRARVGGEYSNALPFEITASTLQPALRDIQPASGGPGQYVTLIGDPFGSQIGKVTFTRSSQPFDSYDIIPKFPDACSLSWWTDSSITIRIPDALQPWLPANSSAVDVYDVTVTPVVGLASNARTFTVTADPATPGICALDPASGPVGTPIQVVGEGFGSNAGNIRFVTASQSVPPTGAPESWSSSVVDGVEVPSVSTSSVQLWPEGSDLNDNTQASNPAPFEVRDCRTDGPTAGKQCCQDGTSQDQCPATGPNSGAYRWTFSTGTLPKLARVLEVCDPVANVYSPAPWDSQGGGVDACVNANITVQLTQTMDLNKNAAIAGIDVFKCLGESDDVVQIPALESARPDPLWVAVESDALTIDPSGSALTLGKRRSTVPYENSSTDKLSIVDARAAASELPSSASLAQHYFAAQMPGSIPLTNGVTYEVTVTVEKASSDGENEHARAGILIGRTGEPSSMSFSEVVLSDEPQELKTAITFPALPAGTTDPGAFIRVYLTTPPADVVGNDATDIYSARFSDLSVIIPAPDNSDPCGERERVTLASETLDLLGYGGPRRLANNIINVKPPGGQWAQGSVYEVIVYGQDETVDAQSKIAMKTPENTLLGLLAQRLDGDGDGEEGGNYRFRFRTRNTAELCEIKEAFITPSSTLLTGRGPANAAAYTNADDPGIEKFLASGVDDPASCYSLDGSRYNWTWSANDPLEKPLGTGLYANLGVPAWCVAGEQCGTGRNGASVSALLETPILPSGDDPVVVRASTSSAGTTIRSNDSDVVIRFARPRVTSVFPTPSCQDSCTNAKIVAMLNMDVDPGSVSAGSGVSLYKCDQENCRYGELGSDLTVGGSSDFSVRFCAAGDEACGLGTAPQVEVGLSAGKTLDTNFSYRVVLRPTIASTSGAQLSGLNYETGGPGGAKDAYSWTFRTAAQACGVDRIALAPDPVRFVAIGQRKPISATAFSRPDKCGTGGQPIDADTAAWDWNLPGNSTQVANFVTVEGDTDTPGSFTSATAGTRTSTNPQASPWCTAQCLLSGSRRYPAVCGNGQLESGEECEPVGTTTPWCDPNTCLRTGSTGGSGGTCGDGSVQDGLRADFEDLNVGVRDGESRYDCDGDSKPCAAGHAPLTSIGEECERVDDNGVPSSDGEFPSWCDQNTCLNKGSGFGSVCGNNSIGDGEDCDDGNVQNGDGCSSRCLYEGSSPFTTSSVRCGDGTTGNGESCDLGAALASAWAAARCDYDRCVLLGNANAGTTAGKCGNDRVDGAGEQCDDGAVGTCSASSDNAGDACAIANDCAGGTCENLRPVGGDGCSAICLLEGASIGWRNAATGAAQPSVCGDGDTNTGEACDAPRSDAQVDPTQYLESVGSGVFTDPTQSLFRGTLTTNLRKKGALTPGQAEVILQCGFTSEEQCGAATGDTNGYGLDGRGCCSVRPRRIATTPRSSTSVCRNTAISVTFDRVIDPQSVGIGVDGSGQTYARGIEMVNLATSTTVDFRPRFETKFDSVRQRDVSVVHLEVNAPLASGARHIVKWFGFTHERRAGRPTSLRTAEGVAHRGFAYGFIFTTGTDICQLDEVEVTPATFLLNQRSSQAPLTATAYTRRPTGAREAIVSLDGTYAWDYAWDSTDDTTVVDTGSNCTTSDRTTCTFTPAPDARNGTAFALANATVQENILAPACTAATAAEGCAEGQTCKSGHCVSGDAQGKAKLRVLLCENPWPEVGFNGGANWEPWTTEIQQGTCKSKSSDPRGSTECSGLSDCDHASGEQCFLDVFSSQKISLAYCRDFGSRKVCKATASANETGTEDECTVKDDCGDGQGCFLSRYDDLPAFATVVSSSSSTEPNLLEEHLLLPRGASYCSKSGTRCDPSLAGVCPLGEFCRPGQDAIGLRIFSNTSHVPAARWYRDQGFAEQATPVLVDGYRGVNAGRSTYVNYANTGSVYTNIAVISKNNNAVPDTQEIHRRVLDELRFNTDLEDVNTRLCQQATDASKIFGRCGGIGAACGAAGDPECAGGAACVQLRCTSDLDCRVGTVQGSCAAPKDKLRRDMRRIEDLVELNATITTYEQGRGSTPALDSGTFIPHITTSKWPSWQQELGRALGVSLPVDPLNAFGGECATPNENYEASTCWNPLLAQYSRPPLSFIYEYVRGLTGLVQLRAGFEYVEVGSRTKKLEPALPAARFDLETRNANSQGVQEQRSASGRCGDGIKQSDEDCDPPGSSVSQSCTVDSASGSQAKTCTSTCQWSALSACSSTCGNFTVDVDVGEQCDVGPGGGPLQPAGTLVPGFGSVQYACNASCQYSGGRCGDSILQSQYGEQCDTAVNKATTPQASSASTQYACTNECRLAGGFCGDGIVQGIGSDEIRCRSRDGIFTDIRCAVVGVECPPDYVCAVRVPHETSSVYGEVCDGNTSWSCIVGNGVLRGDANTHAAGVTEDAVRGWATRSTNGIMKYIFFMNPPDNGSVRVTIVSSNDNADLTKLTRQQIEAGMQTPLQFSDYVPRGDLGGTGVSHRIDVSINGATPQRIWVPASSPSTPQTSEIVIDGLRAGNQVMTFNWTNDWNGGGLDSNLRIHEVRIEGTQEYTCGAPGTANACTAVGGGWQACVARGNSCGNGAVDPGEQCDDGGKGRCVGNLSNVCTKDIDCGPNGLCDQNVDACTSQCRTATCGDSYQLTATCTVGSNIGQPCTSNATCGPGGRCSSEQCDVGVNNWTPTQLASAQCAYGRSCNYCSANSCEITTKQGGFCGDGVVNGVEVCDRAAGPGGATLGPGWDSVKCLPSCLATCPEAYQSYDIAFDGSSPNQHDFSNGDVAEFEFPGCRLFEQLIADVDIGAGVDIWPSPIDVVIVTDRSGSMYPAYNSWVTTDCDGDGVTNTTNRVSSGDNDDTRILCAVEALAKDGGLIDKLGIAREAGEINVALVSYGASASTDLDFLDATDETNRATLKGKVQSYRTGSQGNTNTGDAISVAGGLLTARTAQTKVIILLSDGAANSADLANTNAGSFKDSADHKFIFTVAFPEVVTGMTEWSSSAVTNGGFDFAGDDLDRFYDDIVGAIAGVSLRLAPDGEPFEATDPLIYVDRSRRGSVLNTSDLKTICQADGAQSRAKVKVKFRVLPGSPAASRSVRLSRPIAAICPGPPWPGSTP